MNCIMAEFDFMQDVKITIWARQRFSIEAENYEEALKKVERFKTEDVCNDIHIDADVEWLWDTWEPIAPDENGTCPTIELYDHGNSECKIEPQYGNWPLIGTNTDKK